MPLKYHRTISPLLLLPVLSGILAWISFPKLSQGYAAWFAFVPLLLYVVRVRRVSAAFMGGAIAGFVQFAALLYWIPPVLRHYGGMPGWSSWILFLPVILVLSLYPACVSAVTCYCVKRCSIGFLLVFAPAWVCLEFIRSMVPFGGFPWLLLGYSQTGSLRMMQSADLFGVYGVSFLIASVNSALTYFAVSNGWMSSQAGDRGGGPSPVRGWVPVAVAAAALAAALAYGGFALRRWDRLETTHHAVLLQGNLSIDEPGTTLLAKYQQGYVDMADRVGSKADLIVLPEAPSPVVYQHDADYRHLMQQLASRYPLGMIFNNLFFREMHGQDQYYNCAYFLDGNGKEAGRYDKIHLVPFGEYIPWRRVFFFSETISKDVGSFSPGSEYSTFRMREHKANAIICFEAVFPDLARRFVENGSELIINLTNDAWYGDTAAPYQHLAMARWRAVENRRYLLRAANSGISAIVAPSGRVQGETGLLRPDVAIGGFSFIRDTTFYTGHGRLLLWLCAIISVLILMWCMRRRTEIGS